MAYMYISSIAKKSIMSARRMPKLANNILQLTALTRLQTIQTSGTLSKIVDYELDGSRLVRRTPINPINQPQDR